MSHDLERKRSIPEEKPLARSIQKAESKESFRMRVEQQLHDEEKLARSDEMKKRILAAPYSAAYRPDTVPTAGEPYLDAKTDHRSELSGTKHVPMGRDYNRGSNPLPFHRQDAAYGAEKQEQTSIARRQLEFAAERNAGYNSDYASF